MTYTQQDYEAADREQRERYYLAAEEERERAEAQEAMECQAGEIEQIAVEGWLEAFAAARKAA